MKRFLLILVAIFLLTPTAQAAIAIKPLTKVGQVDSDATGVVAFAGQIMVYGNREKNGFAQFIDGSTVELSCGVESFVSAATVDTDGNFYLVGSSSNPTVGTLPPISGVLNPDNVVPDPVSSNKSDPVTLCIWKLDGTGKIIDSQTTMMNSPVIGYSILADKFGVTVGGAAYANPGNNGFILNWNGKPTYIGRNSTSVFAMARTTDGGVIAVGSSSDKLLNTSLKGKQDGFLAKIVNGKLISVQRSSDIKATRSWRSATSNLLLGGYSNSSAVITKFASNFQPTWTSRYPSNGAAFTATVGKLNYGAFVSTGAIKALPSWKRKNAILLLTFDSKGVISAANYLNSPQIDGFTATSALGPMLLSGGFLYRA